MPRVGPVYSLPVGYLAVTGETIQPSQHNPPLEDIAQAMTDSLPRNGSGPMTGNLAMGSNKITGLAAATASGDAVRFDQVGAWLTSVSALALAADEMVYANGVNTAAKTALTAYGRTLAGLADAAALKTNLGLNVTITDAAATIAANDDDTHVPTNAAVIDYVDSKSIGAGQTWQIFTIGLGRLHNTAYQNTSGRPITVLARVSITGAGGAGFQVSQDGVAWDTISQISYSTAVTFTNISLGSVVVPAGHYMKTITVAGTVGLVAWSELRS